MNGIIATLIIGDKEFKFTTYNNAKLVEYKVDENSINITLKKNDYFLNIKSQYNEGLKLSAPVKGKMERDVFESISSTILVTLKKNSTLIFSDTSKNCGVEIANKGANRKSKIIRKNKYWYIKIQMIQYEHKNTKELIKWN